MFRMDRSPANSVPAICLNTDRVVKLFRSQLCLQEKRQKEVTRRLKIYSWLSQKPNLSCALRVLLSILKQQSAITSP